MTTNEFYYLLLVVGAFAAFAIGLSVARYKYVAWLRSTNAGHRSIASVAPVEIASARAPAE